MEEDDEYSEEEEFETPPAGRNSGRRGGKSAAGAPKTTGLPSDNEDGVGHGHGTDEEDDEEDDDNDAVKELEKCKQKLSSSNKKLQKVGQALVKAKAQLKHTKLLVEQGTNGGKVWWKATKKVEKGKCQNCDSASGSSAFLSLIHDLLCSN